MTVEPPGKVEGKSAKGNAYSFCSRRFTVWDGKAAVICSEVHDTIADFKPLVLFSVANYRVTNARMDGQQMVLRVAVD